MEELLDHRLVKVGVVGLVGGSELMDVVELEREGRPLLVPEAEGVGPERTEEDLRG